MARALTVVLCPIIFLSRLIADVIATSARFWSSRFFFQVLFEAKSYLFLLRLVSALTIINGGVKYAAPISVEATIPEAVTASSDEKLSVLKSVDVKRRITING